MVRVRTFYGYPGYAARDSLRFLTREQMQAYLAAPAVMAARTADLLSCPQVAGIPLLTVERGARLRLAPCAEKPDGWTRVLLADGRAALGVGQVFGASVLGGGRGLYPAGGPAL